MRSLGRVEVSGGFCLLFGVLLFLDEGGLLPWALLACFVHELGHVLALGALGGRVQRLRLSAVGAEIVPEGRRLFGYGEELFTIAAGPAFSILAAFFGAQLAFHLESVNVLLFSGLSLALGVFNLLPAGPLDGGRILKILLSRSFSPDRGELICHWVTRSLALCLLALGLWHLSLWGGNLTLCLLGFWLLAGDRQGHWSLT